MERIQIAGIHDLAEAALLVRCGARQLGFPLCLNVHRQDLSDVEAREIGLSLPRDVKQVVITYLDRAESILDLCQKVQMRMVQIHGAMNIREGAKLRSADPGLGIIKSLIVRESNLEELIAEAEAWTPLVDAFITDTFDSATGASGATGKTHDWEISRVLADRTRKPVFLAGGLNPGNVGRAIRKVRPWGVDCHTGVEGPDGRKDPHLVRSFIAEAERAFRELGGSNNGGGNRRENP